MHPKQYVRFLILDDLEDDERRELICDMHMFSNIDREYEEFLLRRLLQVDMHGDLFLMRAAQKLAGTNDTPPPRPFRERRITVTDYSTQALYERCRFTHTEVQTLLILMYVIHYSNINMNDTHDM